MNTRWRRVIVLLIGTCLLLASSQVDAQWWRWGRPPARPPQAAAGCDRTAASTSASAIQTVLTAAQAGETICIPAGTANWATSVTWTAPANVVLKGAGSLSTLGGGDVTVIVDDYNSTAPLLDITTNASGTFRLAGLTIDGGSSPQTKANGIIRIAGTSTSMRVDHVHFDLQAYATPSASKWIDVVNAYGVIDHVLVETVKQSVAHFNWTEYGGSTNGDGSWAAAPGFGGPEYVYIEDSEFDGIKDPATNLFLSTVTDCSAGAKFVVRYSTVIGSNFVSNHPTGGAGRGRGCRAFEAYGNTGTAAAGFNPVVDTPPFTFAWNTSGPTLIWGNTTTGTYKHFIFLDSMRKSNATYTETATPNGWGYCGTEFNGTGSNWDENTDPANGARCLDQPGSGRGDLLSGNFPNVINTTTGTIAWPHQVLEPAYEWSNTFTAVDGWGNDADNHYTIGTGATSRLVQNRDYYISTGSFTGTVGVGVGTRASRPATCTTGVAYWSTDQGGNWNTVSGGANDGTLDVCTATDTWTNAVYTPYTYPHPLTAS